MINGSQLLIAKLTCSECQEKGGVDIYNSLSLSRLKYLLLDINT